MTIEKLKRPGSDTDVPSSTNLPARLKRLRSLHLAPSEAPQGIVVDNRPEVTDASRLRDINSLLEKAKPELSLEARSALKTIEKYLENRENKPSNDEYKNAIGKALEELSPETAAVYKKYGIEFVLIDPRREN